jgi:invasion protein IalB
VRRILPRAAAVACVAGLWISAAVAQAQAPAAGQQQAPNQVLKETHGAWEVHCIEDTETCAMQQVGETADGQPALQVTVQRLSGVTAGGKNVPAVLAVNTPIGVQIPYGVRARVDDGNRAELPFVQCVPNSCLAQAPATEDAIAELKRGTTAHFAFFRQEEVVVEISLNGFTAAYDSLKPVQATQN